MTSLPSQRIILTGGAGFLGRQVCRVLRGRGVPDSHIFVPRRAHYDLTSQADAQRIYRDAFRAQSARADMVIHLAAEVGGIGANRASPGRFFFANMAMAVNLIEQARRDGLPDRGGKFIHIGTICSYPKFTPVPFREEDLWNGYPEETNAPYGIAKKAAGEMLAAYHRQYRLRAAYLLPVNLYGPHDNFDPDSSHVVPALIHKCIQAQQRGDDRIICWGTGSASREFLYVDDAAEAIVRAAESAHIDEPIPINLGAGREISIADLVGLIAELTGFGGRIEWDAGKPDGQPRRCLDTSRAEKLLGWRAATPLKEGLRRTIEWYRSSGPAAP